MIYPVKFLNDFAELIDNGCIPDIQIEATNSTSIYEIGKPELEYRYRKISINYTIDGVDYLMYVEYDNRYTVMNEWKIGTKNSCIMLHDSESLRAVENFMDKYCCVDNVMDNTVQTIKKEFVNKHTH